MSRTLSLLVAFVCCLPSTAPAQGLPGVPPPAAWMEPSLPDGTIGIQEHAEGGEPLLFAGIAAVAGLAAYDIFTAPASARQFNERNPNAPQKSPRTALLLSAASAAVPIALGALVGDAAPEVAGGAVVLGAVAGPSAGHWYAGQRGRALASAGGRAGLLLFTAVVYGCCT